MPHKASTNWFLTWDDTSIQDGKCFLLQIKLRDVTNRGKKQHDLPNLYVVVYRRHNNSRTFTKIGATSLIREDANPDYADGFRIFYDQQTDLSNDMLKVICFHRRETPPSNEHVVGTATISVRELVRAFGARVNVELNRHTGTKSYYYPSTSPSIPLSSSSSTTTTTTTATINSTAFLFPFSTCTTKRESNNVGCVWFIAEPLPIHSPRGGTNGMEFYISLNRKKHSTSFYHGYTNQNNYRHFITVERERYDGTWSSIYRGEAVRRSGDLFSRFSNKITRFELPTFELKRGEIILGETIKRTIRFCIYKMEKRSDYGHSCIGTIVTSVEQLVNDFQTNTCMDVTVDSDIVGEFYLVKRTNATDDSEIIKYEVEVNFFDEGAVEHLRTFVSNGLD